MRRYFVCITYKYKESLIILRSSRWLQTSNAVVNDHLVRFTVLTSLATQHQIINLHFRGFCDCPYTGVAWGQILQRQGVSPLPQKHLPQKPPSF